MKTAKIGSALALLATASAAVAGPSVVVQPVQVGAETVRYFQGVPTLDLQKAHGAVQVTPLPLDHGSLSFSIAVLNSGDKQSNIDIGSFDLTAGFQALPVFSRDTLERKAKNRAMWTQIGLAALGAAAAAGAASQRDHYRATLITPRGTYHAFYSAPSAGGQVAAAGIVAGTGVAMANVQSQLDATRQALGENIVQLTTVDPGDSYAGQIIVDKISARGLPQRVNMVVHWNGEDYPFAFQVAKPGTPAPAFTALTPSSPPPADPASAPAPLAASAAPDARVPAPLATTPSK